MSGDDSYISWPFYIFQREADSVKIKTKLIDDQTETIRKLKEVCFTESFARLDGWVMLFLCAIKCHVL